MMRAYQLPAAFLIGYGCLDEEHIELVGLLNALRECRADGLTQEVPAFIDALRAHFDREEQLMDQLGYPRAAEHRAHHCQCLEQIAAILEPADVPGPSREDLDRVFSVLVDTIVRVDLYFEEFLIGTGLLPGAKPL